MDGGVRGRPGPTYRAAANLGVRARVWKAGVDFAGDRGRAVARRRRSCQVGHAGQRRRRGRGRARLRAERLACGPGWQRVQRAGRASALLRERGATRAERGGVGARWRGPGDAALRAGRACSLGQSGAKAKRAARRGSGGEAGRAE